MTGSPNIRYFVSRIFVFYDFQIRLLLSMFFALILTLADTTLASCLQALEYQPYISSYFQVPSPSGNLIAIMDNGALQIKSKLSNATLATFDLKEKIDFTHLPYKFPFSLAWTANEDTLILLPPQIGETESLFYWTLQMGTSELKPHYLNYPKRVRNLHDDLGLTLQTQKIVFLHYLDMYGIIANVQSGRFISKKRQVLIVFDANHSYVGLIGYNLDGGYKIARLFRDANRPQVLDILFYHHQFEELVHERWDLQQGLKAYEEFLYKAYEPPHGFEEIAFQPSNIIIRANSSEHGQPQMLRSPNGEYWLLLNVNSDENSWTVEFFQLKKSKKDDGPSVPSSVQRIPTNANFTELEIFWYNRGDIAIIKTNHAQVWVWKPSRQKLEVYFADHLTIEESQLKLWMQHEKDEPLKIHQTLDLN